MSNRKLSANEIKWLRKLRPTLDELSIIDMQRDYRVYRKRWFGNSIPLVEDVVFGRASSPVMASVRSRDCLGFYVDDRPVGRPVAVIIIAKDSGPAIRRLTLLHEMAHMKVDIKFKQCMGHGKYWQKEMKRLARLGAFEKDW